MEDKRTLCDTCGVDNYSMTLFIRLTQTERRKSNAEYFCLPCWNHKQGVIITNINYDGGKGPNPSGRCGIWCHSQEKLDEEERYASGLLTTKGFSGRK